MINFKKVGSVYSFCGYDWSAIGVWLGDDGYYYVATDSGCSCNSAFEYLNYNSSKLIEEYGAIALTADQAKTELRSLANSGYKYDNSEIDELLLKII